MDDSIQVEYVENSFNELNEINNYISDVIGVKSALKQNLNGVFVDVMNNTTTIEVKDNSKLSDSKIMSEIFNKQKSKMVIEKES